jgi:hypothetical protein
MAPGLRLLHGPGRAQAHGSYLTLPPRFEEDLLNDITSLHTAKNRKQKIEDIRAKLNICQASDLLGQGDITKLRAELDKL